MEVWDAKNRDREDQLKQASPDKCKECEFLCAQWDVYSNQIDFIPWCDKVDGKCSISHQGCNIIKNGGN